MINNDQKFYFKISLIIAVAFFIWFFGSSNEKPMVENNINRNLSINNQPAVLKNFVPPTLMVFNDSDNVLPKRNWSIPFLELQADAALAMKSDGSRIYFNKNIEKRRPIASLTKLMTAIVVLENYDLNDVIKIPLSAIRREGVMGNLRPDESLTIRSLLDIMLIDSSNDAAFALSQKRPDFISLMNKKAENLGLTDTHFSNSDGLDEQGNYSSALDVAKIFNYLIVNYPQAFEVLKTKDMLVYSLDGKIEHRLKNTNELLGSLSEVVAGKTGYTGEAGGALALLISGLTFGNENKIITIVLGSPDRFGESEKLIEWLKSAYIWEK